MKEMAFRPISSPRFIRVSRSFPEDAKGRPVRLIPEIFIVFSGLVPWFVGPPAGLPFCDLSQLVFASAKANIFALRSTFRIFDFVLDTPSRHNQTGACIALGFSYL
ncbi:MAG: hypothetical protein ACLRZL_09905 [Alistipes communis]